MLKTSKIWYQFSYGGHDMTKDVYWFNRFFQLIQFY